MVLCGSARGATPLTLVGNGAPSVTVSLTAKSNGALTGTSNIPLSNGTSQRVRIGVQFFANRSTQPLRVGLATRPLAMAHPVTISAGGLAVLTLFANLSSAEPPSDLNGTLVLQERNAANHVVGFLQLALTATLAIPTDVAFEPPDVTLQVTRGQLFYKTTGDQQTVRLRGTGVARLVATNGNLAIANKALPFATLLVTNDAGQETLVELFGLHLVGPGLAEVTVATKEAVACVAGTVECGRGAPSAGSYTGSLALSGIGGGPTLKVTVHSRWWFAIPVLLVLLGAIVGGLLPLLTANAKTKRQLRDMLRTSLDRYKQLRPPPPKTPLAWNIGELLGLETGWYNKRYVGLPSDKGVAPVWSNIHTARSAKDLAEAEAAATELTKQISAWTEAEPLAATLADLRDRPPADRTGHQWRDTQVRIDTAVLLCEVHDASDPSADAASQYVKRLQCQIKFHKAFAFAWERRKRLEEVRVSQNDKVRDADFWERADLDKFDEEKVKAAPEARRSPSEQADLELARADITEAITRLIEAYETTVLPQDVAIPISAQENVEVAKQLTEKGKSSDEVARDMGVTREAVAYVQSQLPQTTAPSAQPSAQAQDGERKTAEARRVGQQLRDATDVILSIVIAVVTAVAYMLPLYTSTWGSWQDWAGAFAAGVVGQVGIKWAVLPALRSKRFPALATD